MVYADYEYYANTYMGTAIKEDEFPRLALRASSYLDYYTQGRAEAHSDLDAVKMCCCALSEQYQSIETAQALAQKSLAVAAESGMELQSETVSAWSRSYRSGGESAQNALKTAADGKSLLGEIARQYLSNTGLLYRGRRCCR